MYNILIVDDEKMICEGIRRSVNWNSLGIGSAFTAFSGTEALAVLASNEISIVLTDINMSGMSGLELISRIRQQSPDMRILVLSGYDRFDYARECLRMSVADFLLKPVDENILADAIRRQIDFLDTQSALCQRRQGLVEQMEIERLITDLLHDRIRSEQDYDILFKKYHFDPAAILQTVFLLPGQCMMPCPGEEPVAATAIKNVCILLIDAQSAGISVIDTDGKVVVTLFTGPGKNTIDNYIDKLTKILKTEYNYIPKIIVGSAVSGYGNLHLSYNDAVWKQEREQNELRALMQPGISQRKVNTFGSVYEELKIKIGNNIEDQTYVMYLFDVFCQAVETFSLSADDIDKCCFDLVSYAFFCSLGISGDMTNKMLHELGCMLAHAEKSDALEMTRAWLLKLYGETDDGSHGIISRARSYIDAHLETGLSVAALAEKLCVTPNYFSRLFRQSTGEGCNEYIVRKRLEKAQLLLAETNLPAGNIAQSVGYNDINYFSLAFKKNTGMSPIQYRKSLRNKR